MKKILLPLCLCVSLSRSAGAAVLTVSGSTNRTVMSTPTINASMIVSSMTVLNSLVVNGSTITGGGGGGGPLDGFSVSTGTYFPSFPSYSNLDVAPAFPPSYAGVRYFVIGNLVTLYGVIILNPTLSATATTALMSLPVPTVFPFLNFISAWGVGSNNLGESMSITPDIVSNMMQIRLTPIGTGNTAFTFTAQYITQ